ncbi:MAG: sigma factor [Planctomycetota bacterium]
MDSSSRQDPGFPALFEAQSASLRRLARSLVGEASADDVVQETWTAYLKHPPSEAGALGGFLATLTRRLAWKARRGEERRSERERMAARMESTPEPDEFTERASVLGRRGKLTVALLVLAILVAWYLGIPRDDASLQAADAASFVSSEASQPPRPAELQASQAASERTALVAASAATDPAPVADVEPACPYLYTLVVRTIDEYGLRVDSPPVLLAPVRSTLNDVVQPSARQDGVMIATWGGKQEQMDIDIQCGSYVTTLATQRVSLRAGTPCEVALLCETSVGRASPGDTPDGRRYLQVSEEHPDDQHFTLAMESGSALRMERLPHPHGQFADRFVRVHHEPTTEELAIRSELIASMMDIEVLAHGMSMPRQIQLGGLNVRHFRGRQRSDPSPVTIHAVDDRGDAVAGVPVAFGLDIDGTERISFTDEQGNATLDAMQQGWWQARAGGGPGGLVRERVYVGGPDPLHWVAHLDRGARIFGRAIDAQGNPVQNLIVRYESVPDVVPRSPYESLPQVKPSRDFSRAIIRVKSDGAEIAAPDELMRLMARESSLPWVDQTSVREDGTFELANLPQGLGRLLVLDKAHPESGALLVEEGVMPSVHEFVLRVPAELGRFRLRLRFPSTSPRPNFEVRAISEATGRGTLFVPDEEGGLVAPSLASGWYRVEVGAGFLGWHDLGRQYVAPGASVDLGSFGLPPPAVVRVIPPKPLGQGAPLDLTFALRRDDVDLRCEARLQEKREVLLLPGGDFWVFWTSGDGRTHHRSLQLESGIELELDLR